MIDSYIPNILCHHPGGYFKTSKTLLMDSAKFYLGDNVTDWLKKDNVTDWLKKDNVTDWLKKDNVTDWLKKDNVTDWFEKDNVTDWLKKERIDVKFIHSERILQFLDMHINKAFKDGMKDWWEDWIVHWEFYKLKKKSHILRRNYLMGNKLPAKNCSQF